MSDLPIIPVARLALRFAPRPWRFADERRAEIDAHFAALRLAKPALWNGRLLLLHEVDFAGDTLRGAYLETDFASFLAWRDWGFPDASMHNCFPMAALQASDGAFLLGVMAAHTANAGKVYFPAGTLDPDDVTGDTVDLDGGVFRELTEETGLARADVEAEPGWHAVRMPARIAMMKVMRSRRTAEELRGVILGHLARQRDPELAGIRVARGVADLDPMMPPYVSAFLAYKFGRAG